MRRSTPREPPRQVSLVVRQRRKPEDQKMLRRVSSFTTDQHGRPIDLLDLNPISTFVVCRDEEAPPAGSMESRQAIVDWIEHCVLGDLRTLRLGINRFLEDPSTPRPIGGCNFLLAAGCCMALEYFGQVYGRGSDATTAARRYVEDFLGPVDRRYVETFGVLWSSFRNGIVHGSWPQVICIQGYRGDRIAVGANPRIDGDHLQPGSDYEGKSFVISAARFFVDIEKSFDLGFRSWVLSQSDEGVLLRAAPRLLEVREGDTTGVGEFNVIRSWNGERAGGSAA